MKQSPSPSEPEDANASEEWTSFDTLVLEGLSGLEESFGEDRVNDEYEESDDYDRDDEYEDEAISASEAQGTGAGGEHSESAGGRRGMDSSNVFRTAREMRAAQEKFAAQRRSAARRQDGSIAGTYDASLLEKAPNPTIEGEPAAAEGPPMKAGDTTARPGSASSPGRLSPVLEGATKDDPSSERGRAAGSTTIPPQSKRSLEKLRNRSEKARTEPVENRRVAEAAIDSPGHPHPARHNKPMPRGSAKSFDETEDGPVARAESQERRAVRVQTERTEAPPWRPEQASNGSFLPAVVSSALITSIIWAGLLLALWSSFGRRWLDERIELNTRAATLGVVTQLNDRLDEKAEVRQMNEVRSDQTVLEARFGRWVQLNALLASVSMSHSREEYDKIIELAKSFSTPEETGYFQSAKRRMEEIYVQRIGQHSGLNIKALFEGHRGKREADLGAEDLLMLMLKEDVDIWDRARAAYLIRRYSDNQDVKTALIEIISSGADLQLVFAAWDSLIQMTTYVPPAHGFDRDHLLHWWNLQAPAAE